MSTTFETTDPQWDEQRDGTFFRIVAHLLPADVLLAATVLLESYDDDLPNTSRGATAGATLAR